jgi:hypothetical protein
MARPNGSLREGDAASFSLASNRHPEGDLDNTIFEEIQ